MAFMTLWQSITATTMKEGAERKEKRKNGPVLKGKKQKERIDDDEGKRKK